MTYFVVISKMLNMEIGKNVQEKIIQIILKYFPSEDVEIFLFGSFAQKKARPSSDIDLCLKCKEKINYSILLNIKSDFDESNLPYKIDLIDYHFVSKEFIEIALKECIKWH